MVYIPSVAFLTGSAGAGEWIVMFVVVLIVVGPRRMPEIARKLGRMMEMFRRAADEFKDQLMTMDQEPPKAPSEALPPPSTAPGQEGASPSGEGSAAPGYDDAYANLSDYPGNEDQVENWSSEAPPEASAPEAAAQPEGESEAGKKPEAGA